MQELFLINLLKPRFAIQSIPDHSANHSPYNMSHMGNIVPNRNTIPDLLPYTQNRHQNERNRYFTLAKICKRR